MPPPPPKAIPLLWSKFVAALSSCLRFCMRYVVRCIQGQWIGANTMELWIERCCKLCAFALQMSAVALAASLVSCFNIADAHQFIPLSSAAPSSHPLLFYVAVSLSSLFPDKMLLGMEIRDRVVNFVQGRYVFLPTVVCAMLFTMLSSSTFGFKNCEVAKGESRKIQEHCLRESQCDEAFTQLVWKGTGTYSPFLRCAFGFLIFVSYCGYILSSARESFLSFPWSSLQKSQPAKKNYKVVITIRIMLLLGGTI